MSQGLALPEVAAALRRRYGAVYEDAMMGVYWPADARWRKVVANRPTA